MKRVKLFMLFASLALIAGCEWVQYQNLALSQHPLSQPLTQAAGKGDLSEVDRLIAAGAPLQEPYSMQAAVFYRQYEMVRHLVGRGGPVNGDGQLQSPLWFAVAHGDTQMTRLLISVGADVNWQTDHMGTPLHAALYSSDDDVNRLDIVRLLLDGGADLNQLQRDEMFLAQCLATPLHAAVFSLDEAVVKLMIDRGADKSATDQRGRTPLQCARERLKTIRVQSLRPQIEGIVALLEAQRPLRQ